MNYPEDYVRYLAHFHGDRDFFECHEVLEEYWKSLPTRDPIWVALIQIAVGMYHHRRGNVGGALKMLRSTFDKMTPAKIEHLGLDYPKLEQMILDQITMIEQNETYTDMNLPFIDPKLVELAQTECHREGWGWQKPSSMDDMLIHRHTLRDRSDVIESRAHELMKRKNSHS